MTDANYVDPLGRVQAYQLALEALKQGQVDARQAAADPLNAELTPQLLRALGSIGANIAEGYARASQADRRRFLEYALGSTRESIVWYQAIAVPPPEGRLERLVSIRRLLLTMIRTSRAAAPHAVPFEK